MPRGVDRCTARIKQIWMNDNFGTIKCQRIVHVQGQQTGRQQHYFRLVCCRVHVVVHLRWATSEPTIFVEFHLDRQ